MSVDAGKKPIKFYMMYNPILDQYMSIISGGGSAGYMLRWVDDSSHADQFQMEDISKKRKPYPMREEGRIDHYTSIELEAWVFVPCDECGPNHLEAFPASNVWG